MTLTHCDTGTFTRDNNLETGTVWKTANDWQKQVLMTIRTPYKFKIWKPFHLVMMFENIVPIIQLCVTSCQNIATVNSSVPDSWWSMWQSRRWCDTWDPDHGLEGALFPHPLLGLECLFALRLVLGPDKRPFPSDTFSVHKNRQQCNPFSGAYIVQGGGGGTEGNA